LPVYQDLAFVSVGPLGWAGTIVGNETAYGNCALPVGFMRGPHRRRAGTPQ